ncbi:MAG: MBL fold metallo-hydrolase [Clostridiales bacterium]|nr:MBL fold metallo-hydrolase [Clostridiales bacterium]
MKRSIRYFLAIALILCFCVAMFAACDQKKPGNPSPTSSPTSSPTGQKANNKLTDLSNVKLYEEGKAIKIGSLPDYYGGKLECSKEGSDSSVTYVLKDTTEEMFLSYLKRLENNGYIQYANNIIDDSNLYTTYTKDHTALTVYYTKHNQCTRIVSEPKTTLPAPSSENVYEKKVDTLLTQLKLSSKEVTEGMSYIYRLCDNTFFLIDGGWPESDYEEADKLYQLLCKQSGQTENITIAGWLFTHAHGDHIGTFNDFIEKYSDQVNIKQLIYNFPNDKDISGSDSAYMLGDHRARLLTFRKNIAEYLPDVSFVKVHSGQRFYLANAEIEILFTLEDLYPETVRTIGMNGSSTIFTVTVEGQKTMFLGDSATQESTALSEQYGDFLKSDMMQVAHHGYGGGTVKLYSLISPSIVLWPVAEASYVQNAGYNHNKFFLNSKDVKQIFVMGFGQYELKLPYVPDSNAERIPDNKYPHIGMLKPTEGPKPTATSDLSSTASPSPGSETEIPKPYFDLAFKDDGSVYDTQNNVSFTMNGGSVGMNTVQHEDKEYSVKSYRAENPGEYIDAYLEDIGSTDDWEDFLLSGCTFEMFVQLDYAPSSTVGLLTSCNGGGATLYIRQANAQLNFQIGNDSQSGAEHNEKYSMAQPNETTEGVCIDGGFVVHVVGTYHKDDNTLNLYYNGQLVASSDFGDTGAFHQGSALFDHLGIGVNVSYPSESLANETPYTVIRSRIYDKTLNAEQVAAEYNECIRILTGK